MYVTMYVYMYDIICMSVSLRLNISKTKGDSRSFSIGSSWESTQGELNGHISDDVTSPDDFIMVAS